jgi:spermidine synthase
MFIKMDKKLLLMPPRVTVGVMCIFAGVAFALGQFGHQYENQKVVAQTNTAYQHLTLTEYESQYTLYSDGLSFFSYPQVQEAEEIQLTLWQKEDVKNIAMVGICSPDKLAEVLKYENVRVNIFENDKVLLDFLIRYLPESAIQSYLNPAVSYEWSDPYINITEDGEDYDFVIINISNPTNAVGNRYFTVDFFKRLSKHLPDDCILSFSLPGSAHLIGRDLQEFMGTIYNALRIGFKNIKIIPGDDYIFLASDDSSAINLNANRLLAAKEKNRITTTFVDSVYLSYRMDEFNLLKAQPIYSNQLSTANTVSRPVIYYYNSILWASRFSGLEETILKFWKENKYLIYILLFLPLISLLNLLKRSVLRPAYFSICFLAGFSGITLEMSLLILYQSHLGNVYSQIGLLIGLFMVGMALGGALPLRSKGTTIFMKKWFYLGAIIGVLVLLGLAIINRFEGHHFFKYLLILGLSFLSGGFSGYLFNYAAVSYRHKYGAEAPGKFYLADLLGASMAGIFISVLFMPLIGFGSILALFFVLYLVYVVLHRFIIIGV